jgi:hypothetical protein
MTLQSSIVKVDSMHDLMRLHFLLYHDSPDDIALQSLQTSKASECNPLNVLEENSLKAVPHNMWLLYCQHVGVASTCLEQRAQQPSQHRNSRLAKVSGIDRALSMSGRSSRHKGQSWERELPGGRCRQSHEHGHCNFSTAPRTTVGRIQEPW